MQGLFGYLPKSVLTHHEEMTHVIDSFDHELPYGSFAKEGRLLSEPLCRKKLVADAYHFLGMPYLWGGCSNHRTKPIGSVDCSALIHLLFRAQGVLIPRDSGPQAEFAKKREVLLPGDLIYLGGH
ncbi:MAG: C40 family peptidase, partial [Chlamydiae bacterium]|nr:C40 family peptidase [Chlamydiota bacterium]